MGPKRIVILGNAGSGKSTLARMLGHELSLPVIHLDKLFWGPGWTKPVRSAFRQKVSDAVEGPAWITEGNYHHQTFDLRLPRAELVIWMETPRLTCAKRVALRTLRSDQRTDLPAGCAEKLDREFIAFLRYVWRFDEVYRPVIEAARETHGGHVPVIRLGGRAKVRHFVETLQPSATTG